MSTRKTFGPFMKLVLNLTVQAAAEVLDAKQASRERVIRCLQLLWFVGEMQPDDPAVHGRERAEVSGRCFRLWCTGS